MTATGCGWGRMDGKSGLDGGLDSGIVLGICLEGWVGRKERGSDDDDPQCVCGIVLPTNTFLISLSIWRRGSPQGRSGSFCRIVPQLTAAREAGWNWDALTLLC